MQGDDDSQDSYQPWALINPVTMIDKILYEHLDLNVSVTRAILTAGEKCTYMCDESMDDMNAMNGTYIYI